MIFNVFLGALAAGLVVASLFDGTPPWIARVCLGMFIGGVIGLFSSIPGRGADKDSRGDP